MLEMNELMEMKDGKIFFTGEGTYPELVNHKIKWIAKRGDGYHDWAIYYGYVGMSDVSIAQTGSKAFTESVIKRLVPCTDEVFGMYRK